MLDAKTAVGVVRRARLLAGQGPMPDFGEYVETWKALEKVYRSGRVKATGVSNFHKAHVQPLFDENETVPAVQQIDVRPCLVRTTCAPSTASTASPPRRGRRSRREGGRPRGAVADPRAVRPDDRIFDFELTDDEMAAITELNLDQRMGADPDTFNRMP